MEIILSSAIGALSAIIVAFVNNKKNKAKKEELVNSLIKELNINHNNVYILDTSKKETNIKYESKASADPTLIIIK